MRPSGRPPVQIALPQPPPRDILVLLGVLFASYAISAFDAGWQLVRQLQLSSGVWRSLEIWQVFTYPFAAPFSGFFFLLSLLMIWWFGGDTFRQLGRARFWRTFAIATLSAGVVAVGTDIVLQTTGIAGTASPFQLMQGARMVLTVVVAMFAVVFAHATLLLFFVVPVKARWFLWLEVLFAFVAFLSSKDFPGFVGLVTAVAVTYWLLTGDGPLRQLDRLRLRLRQQRLRASMRRRRSKLQGIDGGRAGEPGSGGPRSPGGPGGRWVH